MTFTVSDESLNTYGFRVLTSGIQLDTFKKNPVMLYNHNRAWRGTEDEILPIGFWENATKSGGALVADAKFDDNDEFAKKIKSKVESKVLRSCSIGFRVIETSNSPEHLLPGQSRATVTKCELIEISICDIPSNRNAIALYDADGEIIALSDSLENLPVPVIERQSENLSLKKSEMDQLKIVAGFLALSPDASLTDVQKKINELQSAATENEALKAQLKVLNDAAKGTQKEESKKLIDKAIEDKLIDGKNREDWEKNFDLNFEGTKRVLQAMTPAPKLSDLIPKPGEAAGAQVLQYKGKTFDELSKENPRMLEELKNNQPEVFKQLYKSQYGRDYRA